MNAFTLSTCCLLCLAVCYTAAWTVPSKQGPDFGVINCEQVDSTVRQFCLQQMMAKRSSPPALGVHADDWAWLPESVGIGAEYQDAGIGRAPPAWENALDESAAGGLRLPVSVWDYLRSSLESRDPSSAWEEVRKGDAPVLDSLLALERLREKTRDAAFRRFRRSVAGRQ